jgi:hypothetical protein
LIRLLQSEVYDYSFEFLAIQQTKGHAGIDTDFSRNRELFHGLGKLPNRY